MWSSKVGYFQSMWHGLCYVTVLVGLTKRFLCSSLSPVTALKSHLCFLLLSHKSVFKQLSITVVGPTLLRRSRQPDLTSCTDIIILSCPYRLLQFLWETEFIHLKVRLAHPAQSVRIRSASHYLNSGTLLAWKRLWKQLIRVPQSEKPPWCTMCPDQLCMIELLGRFPWTVDLVGGLIFLLKKRKS